MQLKIKANEPVLNLQLLINRLCYRQIETGVLIDNIDNNCHIVNADVELFSVTIWSNKAANKYVKLNYSIFARV